jgi:hypothetical protein
MAEQPNQQQWNNTISKLPALNGNDKDTIPTRSLVLRVEAATQALEWDNKDTFNTFSLCLRADAEGWLQLCRDICEDFPGTWTYIKPLFCHEYGQKMNESKIFRAMKDLGMKHTDTFEIHGDHL